MEGIYKHKETGAEQIFSEATVEILGGKKVWEFVGVFSPNSNEPAEPAVAGNDEGTDVEGLEVTPKVREVEPEPAVVVVAPITPLDKLIEQETTPKTKPKAVNLKDLDE